MTSRTGGRSAGRDATSAAGVAAFGDLYSAHRDGVFRFVRRHTQDDDAAAELTAVAFAKAFESLASFDGRAGGFLPWVMRIARNAAVDSHRRRRPWLYLSALLPTAHPRAPDDPERTSLERDASQRLAAALDRLPLAQREAIALRYGSELTAREIGQVIGKNEEATQKLIRRALDRLQEDLHER